MKDFQIWRALLSRIGMIEGLSRANSLTDVNTCRSAQHFRASPGSGDEAATMPR
jgi:hypothetical protein